MKSTSVTSLTVVAIIISVMSQSFSSVSGRGQSQDQVKKINREVEEWFNRENARASTEVKSLAHVQSEEKHWPLEMIKVLQVATGEDIGDMIKLNKVSRIASGLKQKNYAEKHEFLRNIKKYLTRTFKHAYKGDDREEFSRQRNELCEPLRSTTYFHFQSAIDQLTSTASKEFIENTIKTDKIFGPLYSAAFLCKVIDNVQGGYDVHSLKYEINMPRNIDTSIGRWPYPDV